MRRRDWLTFALFLATLCAVAWFSGPLVYGCAERAREGRIDLIREAIRREQP